MVKQRYLLRRIFVDALACALAVIIAQLLFPSLQNWVRSGPGPGFEVVAPIALACFPVLIVVLVVSDLYEIPRQYSRLQLLRELLVAFTICGLLYFAASVMHAQLMEARRPLFVAAVFALLLMWGTRIADPRLYGRPELKRRMLLLGAHTYALRAIQRYAHEHPDAIELVGVLDDFKDGSYFEGQKIRYLGRKESLSAVLDANPVDALVVLNDQSTYAGRVMELLQNRPMIREVYVRAQIPLFMAQDIEILFVQELPLLKVYGGAVGAQSHWLRDLGDKLIAAALLTLTAPVFLLTAIAIRAESRGPVFYRQRRLGAHNQPFSIFKFRSMVADAELASGAVLAQKNDPRVTRVGRFMRATRIDELPQLINVLRGEMSMVGPRPERPEFQNAYLEAIPWYPLRSLCKPGITGLAQVNGDYHTSTQRKLLYDVTYLANMSPLLNLRILLATVLTVLTKRGH